MLRSFTHRGTRVETGDGKFCYLKKKRNFFVLVYKKDGEKKRKILPNNKAKTRVQSAHGDADDFDGRGAREREGGGGRDRKVSFLIKLLFSQHFLVTGDVFFSVPVVVDILFSWFDEISILSSFGFDCHLDEVENCLFVVFSGPLRCCCCWKLTDANHRRDVWSRSASCFSWNL